MNCGDAGTLRGTTWFVSRHPGAIEWAKGQGLAIDRWVAHLHPAEVAAGDTVIGSLPVNLAAAVCQRGARYLHLSIVLPAQWRGRELSAAEMQASAAELKAFHVEETK
jgi:CRISPR-associated protein Csx16